MGDYNRDRSGGGGRGGRGGFGGGGGGGGRPSFGGGRPSYGRGDDRGGRGYDKPQMHKAICDDCGAPCELPFRPTGDKPVFCRDCFGKGGGGKSAPRGNDNFRERRDDFSRDKRREEPKAPVVSAGITKEQFEMLNNKLDKLLKIVTPVIEVSKEMQAHAAEKTEKSAAKKQAKAAKAVKPAKVEAPAKTVKAKKAVKKAKK